MLARYARSCETKAKRNFRRRWCVDRRKVSCVRPCRVHGLTQSSMVWASCWLTFFIHGKRIWGKLIERENTLIDWYHRLYVSKIMTSNSYYDDGPKGISAYINDPKNLRNAHIINKSHIVRRTSYIANAFEKSSSTDEVLLLVDIIVHTYQKSWQQALIMLMVIKKPLHTLTVRKILRNTHIINKSYIAKRIF